MHTTELFTSITPVHIGHMIGDFNRLFSKGDPFAVDSGSVFTTLPTKEKYCIVAWAVSDARLAAQEGEQGYYHFLHGMAAAFYGLIRLADAQELEQALGPALGMTGPSTKKHESAGEPARNTHMREVQTHFTFQDLVGFFTTDDLHFRSIVEKCMIVTDIGSEQGPIRLLARVDERRSVLILSFALPITVPDQRRVAMAEAITRANNGLVIGHFEMGMSDGTLDYRVVVPINDAVLSLAQFRRCLGAGLWSIDHYMPAFVKVVFNGVTAEQALGDCDD